MASPKRTPEQIAAAKQVMADLANVRWAKTTKAERQEVNRRLLAAREAKRKRDKSPAVPHSSRTVH